MCKNLQKQLEVVGEEMQRIEGTRDAAVRELAYTRAELERYQRDNENLGRQVGNFIFELALAEASYSI